MIITAKLDNVPLYDFGRLGIEVTRINSGVIDLQIPDGVPFLFSDDKVITAIIFKYGKRMIAFSNGEMWEVLKSGDLSQIYFSTSESLPILDLTQVEQL